MKKLLPLLIITLGLFTIGNAQTTLNPGEASIIYWSENDDFGFVTLVDLDPGTTLYFDENGATATGTMASTTEGILLFTVTGPISAGTVIDMEDGSGSPLTSEPNGNWSVPPGGGPWAPSAGGDQVFIYQDPDGPGTGANPTFIMGFNPSSSSILDNCNPVDLNETNSPSSLNPVTFGGGPGTYMAMGAGVGCDAENDHLIYTGTTSFGSVTDAMNAILNPDNWSATNGSNPTAIYNSTKTTLLSSDITIAGGPPSIDTNPMPATTCEGVATMFTVVATDATGYQWEESTDGTNYNSIFNGGAYSGTDGATLTVTPTAAMNGNLYRCVVSGSVAPNATSAGAALTVNTGEPRISSVNPINGQIVIENCSATCGIDITNWQLCSKFSYTAITSGMVAAGNINIPAGGSVTLSWGSISNLGADLGIYVPGGSFGNPAAMEDFVQWGSAGNGRESVAVAKGIWAAGTFVAGSAPYTRTDCNMNMTAAWMAQAISTSAPGCNSFTTAGPASGTGWFNIEDFSGNTIASINPNGANLGMVTLQIDDLATPVQDPEGAYAIPRHFNFESPMFDGAASPFPSPVGIRLFYRADELAAYNAAAGSTLTMNDIVISHYSGTDEDCDITNNADPSATVIVTDITPTASMFNGTDFYLEFNVNHFSEMGGGVGGLFLPVELLGFSGRNVSASTNALNWSTASESNFSHFEIERSLDGEEFFAIGQIDGNGNTAELSEYSFRDDNVVSSKNYYRLKMVDLDETFAYSNVVFIESDSKGGFSIYPNPAKNNIKVQLELATTASYSVVSINGATVMEGKVDVTNNNLDISQLPEGMYILHITGNGVNDSIKFIKE